jgi:hypothetical protein
MNGTRAAVCLEWLTTTFNSLGACGVPPRRRGRIEFVIFVFTLDGLFGRFYNYLGKLIVSFDWAQCVIKMRNVVVN